MDRYFSKQVLFALLLTVFCAKSFAARNTDLCPQNCDCYYEEVNCQNGNLSVIPDRINPQVKKLNLDNNRITEIPIRLNKLYNLETLILSHNKIGKLDKTHLNFSSLLILDLSFNNFVSWNQIQPDSLNFTETIIELDLSHNKFDQQNSKYSLKSNSLRVLKLKRCWLSNSKLNLSGFPSLNELIIADNFYLRDLNFLSSGSLEILDASNCGLELVNLVNLPNLVRASFRGSRINLRFSAFQNKNLQYLDLSDNSIKHVSSNVFDNLPELKTLDLSMNVFVDLHPNTFQMNTKLETLIISHTYLKQLVSFNSVSLINLDLSINEIQHFDTNSLVSMPALQHLNLYRNLIFRLPNEIQSISLQYLNLSTCQIIEIKENTFSRLINLRYLDLSNNRLTYFKRNYFPISLHQINLDRNLWRCECFSNEFKDQYDYLMHPYELADKNSLICHSPENVSGLSWVEACGPIWDGINYHTVHQGKMWMYIISMVLALSVIFCATMCIRRMHQVKLMREQAERMQQRMEAQERINRHRREQQLQIQAQQNAPDPRELQRPPSYHEAIRMPRIDGSYSSLAASRPSLAASRHSVRAAMSASRGSLAASSPDLSKSRTQDQEGRERTTSKSSTGRPRRARTPRADRRRRRRRSRASAGDFDTQSVPDLAADDEATRSMILDSERSEAGEQSEAPTDNDTRNIREP